MLKDARLLCATQSSHPLLFNLIIHRQQICLTRTIFGNRHSGTICRLDYINAFIVHWVFELNFNYYIII